MRTSKHFSKIGAHFSCVPAASELPVQMRIGMWPWMRCLIWAEGQGYIQNEQIQVGPLAKGVMQSYVNELCQRRSIRAAGRAGGGRRT